MTPAVWLSVMAVLLSASFGIFTLVTSARRDAVGELERRTDDLKDDVEAIKRELKECRDERRKLKEDLRDEKAENYRLLRRIDRLSGSPE